LVVQWIFLYDTEQKSNGNQRGMVTKFKKVIICISSSSFCIGGGQGVKSLKPKPPHVVQFFAKRLKEIRACEGDKGKKG